LKNTRETSAPNASPTLSEDSQDSHPHASLKKREANRRNAQLSSGPRTERGKSHSRRNAVKHGILASALLIRSGPGTEDAAEFEELFAALNRDLLPVGRLEEMLVEKVAVCWWRQQRALRCEAGLIRRSFIADPALQLEEVLSNEIGLGQNADLKSIKDHLSLPLGDKLERILRYEGSNQRQLVHAMTQLERMQRIRKGEHVPAPINVQLSSE
jgi:hypothetical protein